MNNWIRTIMLIAVIAHAAGHILFLMPALGLAGRGQTTHSWLIRCVWKDEGRLTALEQQVTALKTGRVERSI